MAKRRALDVAAAAALIGLAVLGAAAWTAHNAADALPDPDTATLDELKGVYGPKLYSQGDEETLIRAFFRDRTGGFFLDVGASHYEKDSTTYYLEKHLGWRGLAIDALEEFRADYERFRPQTRFFAFFVTNEAGVPKDFHVYTRDTGISSGSLERLRGLPRIKDRFIKTIEVPTMSLDRLLAAEKVTKVDFVSLDIEGSEPEALSHGYVPIEHYRQSDPVNMYFRRRDP